jgi:hypothetical protein
MNGYLCFYNGLKDQPDYQELRLSDSFLLREGPVNLELMVKVYNINKGRNAKLLRRCKTLGMYAEFIARVRKVLEKKLSEEGKKRGLQKVINGCIQEGILKGFLIEHSSEVINMIFTEWNWDDYWAVKREEFLEEGIEKGYKKAQVEFGKRITKKDERIRQSQEQVRQGQEQVRQSQERIRQLEEENRRLRARNSPKN